MTVKSFTVGGRTGRYQETPEGFIRMYFDDGEIALAIKSKKTSAQDQALSITIDENPTGVNQYTGKELGDKAYRSSAAARVSGSKSDHRTAGKDHRAAQMQYKSENNVPKMYEHARRADYHEEKS